MALTSKVLKNLDPSVQPCDNFYKFACGSFLRNTNIPDDEASVGTFYNVQDKLESQIRAILETPIKPNEQRPFILAKNLYKACMNKSLIESRRFEPLLKILRSFGGWPVLEGASWDESRFSWQKSVRDLRNKGFDMSYFIGFAVSNDVKNTTRRIIKLSQASFGLSREYLSKGMKDPIVSAYYSYMVDIAVLLGAPRPRAATEAKDALSFQIHLANIALPKEKRRNATQEYNPHTIAELQTLYPSVLWRDYINALLPPGLTVHEDDVVNVNVPSYLKDIEVALIKTSKRILANYVMWRITLDSIPMLPEQLRKRQLEFSATISGITEEGHRWKECTSIVSGRFQLAVGSIYVRKYFKEDAKQIALEMVNRIRAEFLKTLENTDWIDEETRKSALEKAQAMTSHIAYPDEILDDTKLEEYYKEIEIDEKHYMESILNMNIFMTNYFFNKLRKPINKTDWKTHGIPTVVNAYYDSEENSLKFPAGVLQDVFFSADRPQYMNYGAIGCGIGHEITHGFDDQGRQFDKDGNLVDWWAPATKDAYLKKVQCFIEQYGNFTEDEVKQNINGVSTQGENIADNGGIKQAYLAYVKWVEDHGEELQLPGLNYSPKQMFWLSSANTWCSKYKPEAMELVIMVGDHSPEEFRVTGPLSNNEEFAKDFACPLGSPMNPHRKCKVW